MTVVQCCLYTNLMKAFGKTMEILNGIPVRLENIRITVYLPRHIGGSLQQKVIVTVHTSYQLRPSSVVLSVFINTIFLPFASEVAEGSITWK